MRLVKTLKPVLVLSVLVLMAGCSSSSEKNESSGSSSSGTTQVKPESIGVASADIKKSDSARSSSKVEVTAENKVSQLDQAIKSQNDEQIQKWASEIIIQNPKDVKALNALGMLNYKRGRFDAAANFINRAISAQSDKAVLHNNLALVKIAQGEKREAIKLFRKAIELDSRDGVAGANLGALYLQDKEYNKAHLSLEIAYKNGVRDQKTLVNYAVSLAGIGKKEDAAEIYEKILKDFNNSKEAMLNYSILLIEDLQKPKQGLDILNRLKFVGAPSDSRELIKDLENKAKAGLQ